MSNSATEANNIILFPPDHITYPQNTRLHSDKVLRSLEEIKDEVASEKTIKIQEIFESIILDISAKFVKYQINPVATPDDMKHIVLMFESIKALLYRRFGLDHPFHAVARKMFDSDMIMSLNSEEKNANTTENK